VQVLEVDQLMGKGYGGDVVVREVNGFDVGKVDRERGGCWGAEALLMLRAEGQIFERLEV